MDFLKKNKTAIGGGIILILAGYVYFAFFSNSSAPLTTTDVGNSVSGDLLVTLNSLHTIKLDNSIFTNPVFVSLSDFGVSIPPQSSGRGNPFAPLGKGGSPATTTAH
jgi:hypothetical protein